MINIPIRCKKKKKIIPLPASDPLSMTEAGTVWKCMVANYTLKSKHTRQPSKYVFNMHTFKHTQRHTHTCSGSNFYSSKQTVHHSHIIQKAVLRRIYKQKIMYKMGGGKILIKLFNTRNNMIYMLTK